MSTGHSLLSVPSDYATNKSESRYRAHHGAEEILPNWLRKKIAMLEGNIARVLGQSEQLVPLVNEDELYEELQAFV